MQTIIRGLFFLGLAALIVVSGIMIAGPGPQASQLPSEDARPEGYVVLMRSLDLLDFSLRAGMSEPLNASQIFVLPQALRSPGTAGLPQSPDGMDTSAIPASDALWLLLDEFSKDTVLVFLGDHDSGLLSDFGANLEDGAFVDVDVDTRILETDADNRPILIAIPVWMDTDLVHTLIFSASSNAFSNYALSLKTGEERIFALVRQFPDPGILVLERPYAGLGFGADQLSDKLGPNLWIVLLHAGIIALLYAWMGATRFGSLRRVRPQAPRSLKDHLAAIGSFYYRRKPWQLAEELDASYFRQALVRYTDPGLGDAHTEVQGRLVAERLKQPEIADLWTAHVDVKRKFLQRQYGRARILSWLKEKQYA